MWVVALGLGAICVLTGALSPDAALATTERVAPVLAFLLGITVVAELADAAGVFDVAAIGAARLGGGSTRRLWLLLAVLATATTIVLSLDTTAVLLTPVVLAVAQRLELRPLPFAMAAVWLANTASLLLPVSNLTNLLATQKLHLSAIGFAARMALPELAAVAVTTLLLLYWYRRDLAGRYAEPTPVQPRDRLLFRVSASVCLVLGPLFVAGVPVYAAALAAAAVLAAAFAVRQSAVLRIGLVPWRLVLLVEGLFLIIATAGAHGLDAALRTAAGTSGGALEVLRTAGLSAATSNVVNNLPAYLALDRAIPDAHRQQVLAVLVGTNGGPLVLLYGSLATLLWRERCRARDVHVGAGEFARLGLVGVPLVVLAAAGALLAVG